MNAARSLKRRLCWLYALLMTSALFLFAFLVTAVQYGVNDDTAIMRAFLGYETGTPASLHVYIHGLLAWPLHWLSCAFPGQPMFTWMQLALLFLALAVIVKSILQCFVRHEKPLWMGLLLTGAFLLTPGLSAVSRLTYTQTAAFLGMAAVLQMLSADHTLPPKNTVISMTGAAVLLSLAYALRQSTLLPMLAFCGLTFLYLLFQHYGLGRHSQRSLWPMLLSMVIALSAVGLMLGVRCWENQQMSGYLRWNDARTALLDFTDLNLITGEALEAAGWSHETFRLFQKWCFLSSDMTPESVQLLADYAAAHETIGLAAQADRMWETVKTLIRQSSTDLLGMGWLGIVCLFVLADILQPLKKKRWKRLFVWTALGASAVMLLYLAWQNRLPMRALLVVILPMAGVLLAMLAAGGSDQKRVRVPLCCILCAVYASVFTAVTLPRLMPADSAETGSPLEDLEEYALWEPESLFIYDHSLAGGNVCAFPDYSEGIPHNVTGWGGWNLRSPESVEQFARFGIDLLHFDPETLLREDVFIASARSDGPLQQLTNWLQSELGPDVEYEYWSENGSIYLYHYYRTGI